MKRNIYNSLIAWKNSKNRKPLVLYGARQVGKTYILKEFGKNEYKNTLYLNFDKNNELRNYFADNISPHHIINSLKTIFKQEINTETLLIFDEIQYTGNLAEFSCAAFVRNAAGWQVNPA